jgi:hypothetical protein
MKPLDESPDFHEVAGLWRAWLAKQMAPPGEMSPEEALVQLRTAKARAERRWLPPQVAVGGDLAVILGAWQADWTHELRTHADWPAEASRLAEVRTLLTSGQLADAGHTIESILSECCRGARKLLAGSAVRALDTERIRTSEEKTRTGLEAIVRWLEHLR